MYTATGVGAYEEVKVAGSTAKTKEYDDYIHLSHLLAENATSLLNLTEEKYRQKVDELIRDAVKKETRAFEGFNE
jgi:hypothetical protein